MAGYHIFSGKFPVANHMRVNLSIKKILTALLLMDYAIKQLIQRYFFKIPIKEIFHEMQLIFQIKFRFAI